MSDIHVATDGAVLVVTIDAPPVNAFTMARYERLSEIFEEASERSDVHCVVLTATGTRAFCAGLDLGEFLGTDPKDDPVRQAIGRRTFAAIRHCRLPVIAAVNGVALGAGIVFAAVCDFRIASDRATFGLPEINVGRCGGAAHVGRLIPQGMVRKMFFTGEAISAYDALRVGFVEQVVAPRLLVPTTMDLAHVIASKSPLGLRIGKQALNEAEGLPVDEGYELEQRYSTQLLATHDSREALRAVVEKRRPMFTGR
jgi:enoyl-CoA hydratase